MDGLERGIEFATEKKVVTLFPIKMKLFFCLHKKDVINVFLLPISPFQCSGPYELINAIVSEKQLSIWDIFFPYRSMYVRTYLLQCVCVCTRYRLSNYMTLLTPVLELLFLLFSPFSLSLSPSLS